MWFLLRGSADSSTKRSLDVSEPSSPPQSSKTPIASGSDARKHASLSNGTVANSQKDRAAHFAELLLSPPSFSFHQGFESETAPIAPLRSGLSVDEAIARLLALCFPSTSNLSSILHDQHSVMLTRNLLRLSRQRIEFDAFDRFLHRKMHSTVPDNRSTHRI